MRARNVRVVRVHMCAGTHEHFASLFISSARVCLCARVCVRVHALHRPAATITPYRCKSNTHASVRAVHSLFYSLAQDACDGKSRSGGREEG
jgi:hypothetical protein